VSGGDLALVGGAGLGACLNNTSPAGEDQIAQAVYGARCLQLLILFQQPPFPLPHH
jgi:hypothetical protein